MQSFIATLAERRVNNLMNDDTRKLAEYVTAHTGFPLFDTAERLD
jgi:histidine ammonia-lyase